MLRSTRLAPGSRAVAPRHPRPTSITATRPLTYARGTGSSASPFTRPPSSWSPSTMSTLALGSMLVGTWYIVEEGRSYKVGDQVGPTEPRVLGTHRQGTVNPDYQNYEAWVERHKRRGAASAPPPGRHEVG